MDQDWTVIYKGFDKKEHPLQEALCSLGNGYFVIRGGLEMARNKTGSERMAKGNAEAKSKVREEFKDKDEIAGKDWNYPGTYLAGGYNRLKSVVQNKIIENEDLVNWPNWMFLNFRIDGGEWFDLEHVEILHFETRLHLKAGILERIMRFCDAEKRETSIISRRLVSMDNYHLSALQWQFKAENWSGKVTFRSGIDGCIINNNVARYADLNQDHIEVLEKGAIGDTSVFLVSRSRQSQIIMAQGAQLKCYQGEKLLELKQQKAEQEDFIAGDFKIEIIQGNTITLEKTAALFTSRDFAISDPLNEAKNLIQRMPSFELLEEKHSQVWEHLWHYNDIVIKTSNGFDQLVLRLHIFHLYQTVSNNSIDYDIGIPARGWHGEAYRGHIFWDELYIQPFIDLHHPQLSRSLLMYRYRRLPEAQDAAREAGYRGAMFPWQSGSNGREETQKVHLNPESGRWMPDVSHLQHHINAAIPYNVWHYYQSTGDMDFLLSHGAELILSTALFWSSIAQFNEKLERYEIRNVMGPDEYHTHYPDSEEPGLHNNAYTNIMAVWVIQHALDLLELLDQSCCINLAHKVEYTPEDIDKWKDITKKMHVPFNKEQIIMQFEGYENLKELDWQHYYKKYGSKSLRLDRILESEGDSCNFYKASKQADVLMLFYLFSQEELSAIFKKLGYNFDPDSIPKNIEFYRKRTAHGSTLSQVIHAWVYARSRRDESWRRFREALMSDFRDVQGGTTHEGIHLGAMAGTLDLVQRCYSGLEIRDDVLWFNPRLPDDIALVSFHLRYRGHWMKLIINQKKLSIQFDKGWANPVTIGVKGVTHLFETNDCKIFYL
ncbi:MAG: glycosyl hydrolase family 65 protein [Bacteroides sp.]|jgi:trehalose/maltose hydrolase-like predicted phosphorylase|nr:glycosyl hydrolase family 65 protein [Bacteroides sp.]